MKNSDFYDIISLNYDNMVDFENSLTRKIEYLRNFKLPHFRNSLDLGCGTGADSIALAKIGLKVDSVDQSAKMLEKAISNCRDFNVEINFSLSDIAAYKKNKKYDLIVSFGNTLANISKLKIEKIVRNLKSMLNTKGKIIIQLINFAKLPDKGIYQLNIFENSHIRLLREYEIKSGKIEFIIKIFNKKNDKAREIRTEIFPHSKEDLIELALANDLIAKFFGNLAKEPYLETESENLVAVLSK